jgi:4-hydroxy-tetrahydrodipicolinate reductase
VTRIALHGAAGRMGRSLVTVIAADVSATLGAALDHAGHPAQGQDLGVLAGLPAPLGVRLQQAESGALDGSDVLIDFSLPAGTRAIAERCAKLGLPMVVGTTGLDAEANRALEALAKQVPIVVATNYSVGVNLLWALAERAVELAGDAFDLEIVEMHHHHKVDAPSGTAVTLLERVARARGVDPKQAKVAGRDGAVGARRPGEIGVHALRGGDVVGDHTLIMAGPGERLELSHRAQSREIFARGAVRAAHWVVGRPAGRYSMADVLGLA